MQFQNSCWRCCSSLLSFLPFCGIIFSIENPKIWTGHSLCIDVVCTVRQSDCSSIAVGPSYKVHNTHPSLYFLFVDAIFIRMGHACNLSHCWHKFNSSNCYTSHIAHVNVSARTHWTCCCKPPVRIQLFILKPGTGTHCTAASNDKYSLGH